MEQEVHISQSPMGVYLQHLLCDSHKQGTVLPLNEAVHFMEYDYDWVDRLYLDYETKGGE